VVGTANGHEALELVTAKRVRPELVLSDFNLPGRMNGVETIQALRKALGENVPAIVLTGDIRSEVLDAIALHDVRVATKPVNADQLMQLVRQQQAQAAAE
jgi:CheY-like chemotaxis protein